MGRFIVIGILYKVRVNTRIDDNIASSLKVRFPEELFDYKQIKEKQMLSLREEISPKSIADLRTKVLSVCNLPQEKDEELNTHFKESIIADIVKESLHCHYLYTVLYNFFRWRSYEGSIPIHRDSCSYKSSLAVTQYGIQIYLSASDFTSEFEGELSIMLNPLRHILNRVSNPFNNILSIQIERAPVR